MLRAEPSFLAASVEKKDREDGAPPEAVGRPRPCLPPRENMIEYATKNFGNAKAVAADKSKKMLKGMKDRAAQGWDHRLCSRFVSSRTPSAWGGKTDDSYSFMSMT